MQHRAAFARAMMTRPSVLLMDEPFGALDAFTRLRMHEFLLAMWEQYRITIIFVTHDIEEAVLLGDRVAVMGGRPPGIRELIDVPLARPRHAADIDTAEFVAVKRRIRASLTDRRELDRCLTLTGTPGTARPRTPPSPPGSVPPGRRGREELDDRAELLAHRRARRRARPAGWPPAPRASPRC